MSTVVSCVGFVLIRTHRGERTIYILYTRAKSAITSLSLKDNNMKVSRTSYFR